MVTSECCGDSVSGEILCRVDEPGYELLRRFLAMSDKLLSSQFSESPKVGKAYYVIFLSDADFYLVVQ